MKVFGPMYERALGWARHPRAPALLTGLSFAEAVVFPVPPEVMLAPMCLADRDRAWWYALITTVSSVAGGVIGYLIGMFFFDAVGQQIIEFYDARDKFDKAVSWFDTYGVWIVFIAGFSPIPYKLFTITSGLLGMALVPFILASIVGRAGQFFLVAALVVFGGERLEGSIRKYVEWLGWAVVAAAVVLWLVTRGR